MPFGDDCQYENFDACVRDNQDKDDPDAYCAELMRRTEDHCKDKGESDTEPSSRR